MCASKLKLPESLASKRSSGTTSTSEQEHLTRRAEIAGNTKMATARMELVGQALDVVKQGLRVLQSYNELKSSCVEWQGRVQVADSAYRTALAELDIARAKHIPEMQRLKLVEKAQQPVVELFNDMLAEAKNPAIGEDERRRLTTSMLQLSSDLMASLR
ncbi:hypothetical protein [Paraburkholderia terrae]